jgi:2-polyprenyl-3-methyl-5-hydroxy-6-metoxy-1,4-benzoquinol methylase
MYLTEPQSSHFSVDKFRRSSSRENQFDWDLYYRFKDQRERFWQNRLDADAAFRQAATEHFEAFHKSIKQTLSMLSPGPDVLDIGLSSEQLDRAILSNTAGTVAVVDLQQEAGRSYESAFAGRGSFFLSDVITFSRDEVNAGRYDLVYSVGLLEHFPDKSEILDAHVRLTKPGGLVLIYVPTDTPANRGFTKLAFEWENFGHRELLTPAELERACQHGDLDIIRAESVGFFSAVWARRRLSGVRSGTPGQSA